MNNTGYRVDIETTDGEKVYFASFVSEEWARYHIAIAQTAPDSIYKVEKYKGAKWTISEEKDN